MRYYQPTLKTLAGLALCTGLATFASASTAAVITWDYTVESVFTGATPTGPGAGFVFGPTEISWGDPSGTIAVGGGRSAISIFDTPANGQVDTNGAPANANTFEHENHVVDTDVFPQLDTASIRTTVTLTPSNPPPAGPDPDPLQIDFVVNFAETLNTPPTGETCPVGNPPCDDIFVISSGALDFPLSFEGEDYFISVFELTNQLTPLPIDACAAAGAGPGCIGFLTQEDEENIAQFAFTIRQIQIPEPAMLLLTGGILSALAIRHRRRDRRVCS